MGAALTDREQGLLVTGGRQRLGQSRRFEADNSFWGLTTVLTTTPADVHGFGDTQKTIRRIELRVRLHSSVGRAADS
jgi:hypothetical protein